MNLDSVFLGNKGSRNTESTWLCTVLVTVDKFLEVMELKIHPVSSFLAVPAVLTEDSSAALTAGSSPHLESQY